MIYIAKILMNSSGTVGIFQPLIIPVFNSWKIVLFIIIFIFL